MRRLSRILALILAAVWLPVTQHCGLEGAGLIAMQCEHDCASGQVDSDDGCCVVEKGQANIGPGAVKVQAPVLLQLLSPLDAGVVVPTAPHSLTPELSAVPPERPRDWISTWHFVRRAAPLSRAPSPSCA